MSTQIHQAVGLATPLVLPCGARLQNRIAKSATSEALGDRARAPTAALIRLYRRWADSGAGLLITGNVMIDRRAIGERGNVAIEDDRHRAKLAEWAGASTAGGGHAWVQLNHPGRQAPRTLNSDAVGASPIAVSGAPGMFRTPRPLTEPDIEELIQRFATTARLVVDAGFTGVEIQAAHGYLISQFLSPLTNQRTDRWGGTPANRRRFLIEVVRAVRAALGPGTPVAVKLNSADFQRGGMTEEESTEVILALAQEQLDVLEISGGSFESTRACGECPRLDPCPGGVFPGLRRAGTCRAQRDERRLGADGDRRVPDSQRDGRGCRRGCGRSRRSRPPGDYGTRPAQPPACGS
jgi:2,4-dienoyl-CoA reductase-like NADH-dependent reductase (Old Yellow Enzyme family)